MKVAIVHDDLVQWGGAEKVLLGISEIFPDAPIYTSVFDRTNFLLWRNFGTKKIITSFMQRIPGWKNIYKLLLPLYPIAFEQFDFTDYDLVISHTTRFAKSVITKPETKHICYIHTPPRFLWGFSGEKVPAVLNPYLSKLRVYDEVSANRADVFFAGSKNCRERVKKIYGKDCVLIQPFVDTENNKYKSFEGDYYLIIARLNAYKRVDVAVDAFNKLNVKLKIVGRGPELDSLKKLASNNIEFLEFVTEDLLNRLLSGCKGLIITAEEDFGLSSLEAQSFSKPVIAFGRGGVLETVVENKTGLFFPEQDAESLIKAVEKSIKIAFNSQSFNQNLENFSKEKFKKRFLEQVNYVL